MCLPMSAAAIFQLSGPSDRIGTNRYATTVATVVATVAHNTKDKHDNSMVAIRFHDHGNEMKYKLPTIM